MFSNLCTPSRGLQVFLQMQTSLKELTTLVVILIPERSNITYIYDGYFMGYYLVQSATKVTENYANCQGKIFLSSASNKFTIRAMMMSTP